MKLFSLLQQLDSREKAKFTSFLEDGFFNKRKDVKLLFASWVNEKGRSHPPEFYWKKIFPNANVKTFTKKDWNLLTSRTLKLLEDFLAIKEMLASQTDKKFFLAKAYRKLQKEKWFKTAVKDTELALEKQIFRSTHYLQQKHDLAYEEYDYIQSFNRKERTNLQEVSDSLNAYFLATKIRQGCIAISRKTINQEVYEIDFLEEALAFVDQNPSCLKVPAIAMYFYCYKAITSDENESYFRQLRTQIETYQSNFPPSEIRDIYFVAINYCIRRLNTGTKIYVREALELYRLSLEAGYLLEDGIMPESTFGNIVSLALKLKEYDWAKSFLEKYQNQLHPNFQAPLFHFSMAKLFYEENEIEESMQQLSLVVTKAPFLFLGARTLQLKIYFELNEYDLLESLLESLRVYLQRRKDLGYRRENYDNLISFAKVLLQLPIMSKKEIEDFRKKVIATAVFSEKEWCLNQIKKFKK
ncbi:MAG: hypothetical protein AB8H03_04450 [Saprospiraceae bacterium]